MDSEQLKTVLEKHKLWLNNEDGGERANLSKANLSEAKLSGANLREANLSKANLSWSNLRKADLREANLSGVNLTLAKLSKADFSGANLSGADLSEAKLSGANLSEADLVVANLSGADLSGANLFMANLSGADGILSSSNWMAEKFGCDENGYIVYRSQNGQFKHPDHWVFENGKFLTEIPNPDRCTLCACGVSFATLDWCRNNYKSPIWKCRINWRDLPDVIVPFNTDGKARCARLELLEVME